MGLLQFIQNLTEKQWRKILSIALSLIVAAIGTHAPVFVICFLLAMIYCEVES